MRTSVGGPQEIPITERVRVLGRREGKKKRENKTGRLLLFLFLGGTRDGVDHWD